jgi:hypothetical protein
LAGLILHIGMHKTGSSAIQRFLLRARPALWLHGVAYPREADADGRPMPKQNRLFLALSHEKDQGRPHPVIGPSAALVERIARRAAGPGRLILSSEGLSGPWPGFAAALAPLRGRVPVRVICLVRRQDDWALSMWRQLALRGTPPERRPFRDWLAAPDTRAHLDHAAMLDRWATALGEDSIRVVRYHPAGMIPAFLAAAGLPGWMARLPGGAARVNESLDDAEFRRLTGMSPPDFTAAERAALMAGLSAGNDEVRQRFPPGLPVPMADETW